MKTCTKCGQVKPPSEFHKSPTTRDQLRPDCKVCNRASARAWYATHKTRALAGKQVYGASPAGKATRRKYVSRIQNESTDRARSHRKEWTGPELELAADPTRSIMDVAKALGRTYFAVQNMRQMLRLDPRKARMAGTEKR